MLIVPACAAPDPAATPDVTDAWQPLDAVIVDAVLYDVRAKEPDTPDSGPSDIPEPDAAETPDVVDPLPPPEPFVAYGPAQSARYGVYGAVLQGTADGDQRLIRATSDVPGIC